MWNSTARFHVGPWPYKFATVLNIPAFLIGAVLSLPLGAVWPSLPESVLAMPVLLLVPVLWYVIGAWLDQMRAADVNKTTMRKQWISLFAFIIICAVASSLPANVGGYVSYLPLGILVWAVAGSIALVVSRKYKPKNA